MDLGLKGKTALVTGGSHGIGLATAILLAEEGCSVHIASRHPDAVTWPSHLAPPVRHIFDALDAQSVDGLAQEVCRAGGVGILVNHVGGGGRWGGALTSTTLETYDEVYQKNARTALRLTKAVLPGMYRRGWGRIVTTASVHGREAGSWTGFMMAKAAEIALMKGLATAHQGLGVTFNTVAPGYIRIEGKDTEPSRGAPEDVAAVIVFLCSEAARHVNGACVVVDGGEGKAF